MAFAGYEMPIQYAGVIEEHRNVRSRVGLFDVSHMGEVFFEGSRATEVVDRIVTNHVGRLADGQACYTVMCRPDGGILDDLVVYKFDSSKLMICVNAATRTKDVEWMKSQAGSDCEVRDESAAWAQIAVQGPAAAELIRRICEPDPTTLVSYRFLEGRAAESSAIIARTGYTGEDGFELYVPAASAEQVWDRLMDKGGDLGVAPAGLGARDSLRLEMCFPLYGQDIDETTNPYEAGLGWVVKLQKPSDFVGRAALEGLKGAGPKRKLTPLMIEGRGIARAGYDVLENGRAIGKVTSGTKGPSVDRAIALAFVPIDLAKEGTELAVAIRNTLVSARVVKRPFLQR